MSDNVKDLTKHYEDNVFNFQHPRSIGLFPIPEYPEFESGRGMWSEALNALLTTLRYLAPATLLTLFWGQQSFLFRLLKSIDSTFRAIVFSSEEQKQAVLQWLAETGSVRVEHLDTVWRHGWILCGVLDAALPGACAGHPPTRLSLKHAQAIADHYLGVEPVFTRQELESNDSLSKHQEWKLATYLDRIREALSKLTPPVSKPSSQRTSPETTQFTLDYVARGSGLTAAQVNNKMYFKVYPTSQQSLDPGEITILIRGPKDTYGMTVLPPILGKAQMIRQKLLGLNSKPNFTESALPITQGAAYLRSYGKTDMNKTYFIPKSKYDIEIEEEICEDHVKIGYTVAFEGKHELSITSRGQNIMGSPFTVTACNNIIGILENESFCLEDGEEIDIVDVKTDRKVVLRIVDFVTEKMLLKENGSLEKISDDEAKILMSTDNVLKEVPELGARTHQNTSSLIKKEFKPELTKFKEVANKVIKMNRICQIIQELTAKRQLTSAKLDESYGKPRTHQQAIPDIVNSTFGESKHNPFILPDKRDKIIIPENISVSICTEKSKPYYEEGGKTIDTIIDDIALDMRTKCDSPDSLETYETLEQQIEEDILVGRSMSTSNPFLNDMVEQNYAIEKDLGSFVKTEYETNNSQNEETENTSIKIMIQGEDSETPSPTNRNPFIEPDVINLERPKTPVLKIITGDIQNREDSVYVDPKTALIPDEILGNEFINPFFIHHHPSNQAERIPITDFIIGAPVSLPPIVRAATPEPHMESILITDNDDSTNINRSQNNEKIQDTSNNDISSTIFSTPVHTSVNPTVTSTFHSLDSNVSDNVEVLSLSNASDGQEQYQIETIQSDRQLTPKKDIWDSAYVSIDDSNSSPDSNNNDNLCETPCKPKFPSTDSLEFCNMGPAEREIWQTELKQDPAKMSEDVKPKWETKRPIFTPILEETDRSIPSSTKNDANLKHTETDAVTVAFAEINDLYHDYFPKSESSTVTAAKDNEKLIDKREYMDKRNNDVSVDSASALSDVKRHAIETEGKISEVQANVTESVSVSQTLHYNETEKTQKLDSECSDETQFGDKTYTNIVLERKQYWDEKIREIEAKSEENKTQQRKRRLSSKHLRHNDSLTKRRGKQILKNFLSANEQQQCVKKPADTNQIEIVKSKSSVSEISLENIQTDTKFVEKWKQFWDGKLETNEDKNETTCFKAKSPKNKELSKSSQHLKPSNEDIIEVYQESKNEKGNSVKQELPEEVFKAFETSPKRFFGTSRKQILNKIDTFLGKPSTADESPLDVSGASPDTGLVSSRISLFHNITQTEELPWARRKCQSMHNISQRKDSEKSATSVDENVKIDQFNQVEQTESVQRSFEKPKEVVANVTTEMFATKNKGAVKEKQNPTLKEKRARMIKMYNKTVDDTVHEHPLYEKNLDTKVPSVQKVIKEYNKYDQHNYKYKQNNNLRKSSMSKSEMDIFNKFTKKPCDDDLDKYKSCDELPKINVKNFISLYENVSRPHEKPKLLRNNSKANSMSLQKPLEISSSSGAVNAASQPRAAFKNTTHENHTYTRSHSQASPNSFESEPPRLAKFTQQSRDQWRNKSRDTINSDTPEPKSIDSVDLEIVSLSDEIERVDSPKKPEPSTAEESESAHLDYKFRFKSAKQFFQSLEELREEKKPKKLNDCELLLVKSTESLENERTPKRVKKNIKSHSMPSSEISKIWNQLQETQNSNSNKLVKISEKFNVDDLFNDVVEGKFSRQGSLRGIPHKNAVLEAFRSMENLNKISPYEIAAAQLSDFAKENMIKNAQTCLSEYPYLPTTDPSKYHSRLDTKASGLISFKELLNQKPRRNSVPDLRMNAKFTVDL